MAFIKMIWSTDTGIINGALIRNTLAGGMKENNMDLVL